MPWQGYCRDTGTGSGAPGHMLGGSPGRSRCHTILHTSALGAPSIHCRQCPKISACRTMHCQAPDKGSIKSQHGTAAHQYYPLNSHRYPYGFLIGYRKTCQVKASARRLTKTWNAQLPSYGGYGVLASPESQKYIYDTLNNLRQKRPEPFPWGPTKGGPPSWHSKLAWSVCLRFDFESGGLRRVEFKAGLNTAEAPDPNPAQIPHN